MMAEAKEEIIMDHFEMVEKLRQKANVSYEEAKAALEASDWDILDALVLLESEGKMKEGEPQPAEYTTQSKKTYDYTTKNGNQVHAEISGGLMKLWGLVKKLFQKGNSNQFVVTRQGEELISLPVTVLVILLVCFWWLSVILLLVGLFLGARYSFRGPDSNRQVNAWMDKAADAVQNSDENKKE